MFYAPPQSPTYPIKISEYHNGVKSMYFDQLYLSRPAVVHFFQANEPFCKGNVKLWPLSANFGYFPVNLCIFDILFTDLNSVVVYQN